MRQHDLRFLEQGWQWEADISDLPGAGADDCGAILARWRFQLSQLRRRSHFFWEFHGGPGADVEGHYLGRDDLLLRVLASPAVVVAHAGLPVVRDERGAASPGEPGLSRGEHDAGFRRIPTHDRHGLAERGGGGPL